MPNPFNLNSINQVYLSGASDRFVSTADGQYFWWNDFNRSYQPIDTSSLSGKIIGINSDNAGNLAFLTFIGGPPGFPPATNLSIWNVSTQSFEESQFFPNPWLSATGAYSFALINTNEFLLVVNGALYHFTPPTGEDWDGNTIYGTKLGTNFVTAVTGLDGSAWALDQQGQAWLVDGTEVSLFNGSNNPPFHQLSVVDKSRVYGLGKDGRVYQWSVAASSFVDMSSLLDSVPPQLEKIQVDAQGILYGIGSQGQAYRLFDTTAVVDMSNPNGQPSGLTTITDSDGVTHAIWNENGQIYYGYQQEGGNGQYIGVGPMSSGIGSPALGSSTDLVLANSGGIVYAYWIDSDGNDNEVYSSALSPSPYGGYRWSPSLNLTNDDHADSNLIVTALNNDQVLITTRKEGLTQHRTINPRDPVYTQKSNVFQSIPAKGNGYIYDFSTPSNKSGLLGSEPYDFNVFPGDFSIAFKIPLKNKNLKTNKRQAKSSITISLTGSIDNQLIKKADGKNIYVPSNAFKIEFNYETKETLRDYISQKLNLGLQSSAKWPGVQPYPGSVSIAAYANYELAVDTLPMILDYLAPGLGDALYGLNKSKILELKLEALFALDATVGVTHADTSPDGDNNYYFELVTKNLNPAQPNNSSSPAALTPVSDLVWLLKPQNLSDGGFLNELFTDPTFSASLSFGGGVQTTAKIGAYTSYESFGIKIKIKSVQTETLTNIGGSAWKFKSVFTYKWSVAADVIGLFSIEYSGSNSILEYEKEWSTSSGLSRDEVASGSQQSPPGMSSIAMTNGITISRGRVMFEPKSTSHLLAYSAMPHGGTSLSSEDVSDLVDSADIAYVLQGNKAYGTFAGSVNDDSGNFTYLYLITGTANQVNQQTTIVWDTTTLQTVPNTSGANQSPEIAIDSQNNVLITWQYESITNPIVASIATTPPGQVYVVYGQGSNNPINLSTFSENPKAHGPGFYWTLHQEYFAGLGQQVTALGDLNGGGKRDFAFTAPDLNDEQGGVYIIYSESYSQINDLDSLGAGGIYLSGETLGELGYSISNVGDVSGDGKSDLIVGAPGLDNNQGGAYLLYGGQLFTGSYNQTNIDGLLLANPSFGQQFTNLSGQPSDRFGTDTAGAHDLNGDKRADFAISAPEANQGTGAISLYLSKSTPTGFTLSVWNDGNMYLLDNSTGDILWSTYVEYPPLGFIGYFEAEMQADGNLVLSQLINGEKINYWSTNTSGHSGAYLTLADDGGLYIRDQEGNNIQTLH